eukprot:COSAG02_NODE_53379_length_302_cov_0.768473_1_plen_100_part_11
MSRRDEVNRTGRDLVELIACPNKAIQRWPSESIARRAHGRHGWHDSTELSRTGARISFELSAVAGASTKPGSSPRADGIGADNVALYVQVARIFGRCLAW